MTYRECAIRGWTELGWSEEKIKQALAIRDKNAFVISGVTYKPVPPEIEREVIDFLKELENAPEEEKNEMRSEAMQLIEEKKAKADNN